MSDRRVRPGVALTVAGLDPGGGAGIAADLRTFAAERVWGCAVATAITFQNTARVAGFEAVSAEVVGRQIKTLLSDVTVDAVKTGMLGSSENCAVVARTLNEAAGRGRVALVVDPVMVSSTHDRLATDDVCAAIVAELLPLATIITPNFDESESLLGWRPSGVDGALTAARDLVARGATAAFITGGSEGGTVFDVLVAEGEEVVFRGSRIDTADDHGTGCVLSAAIAAGLAMGDSTVDAVARGRKRVRRALAAGFDLGAGRGPVDPLG